MAEIFDLNPSALHSEVNLVYIATCWQSFYITVLQLKEQFTQNESLGYCFEYRLFHFGNK